MQSDEGHLNSPGRGDPHTYGAPGLDGLNLTSESDSTTAICRSIVDEDALSGSLGKMGDLAVPLAPVHRIAPGEIDRAELMTQEAARHIEVLRQR